MKGLSRVRFVCRREHFITIGISFSPLHESKKQNWKNISETMSVINFKIKSHLLRNMIASARTNSWTADVTLPLSKDIWVAAKIMDHPLLRLMKMHHIELMRMLWKYRKISSLLNFTSLSISDFNSIYWINFWLIYRYELHLCSTSMLKRSFW